MAVLLQVCEKIECSQCSRVNVTPKPKDYFYLYPKPEGTESAQELMARCFIEEEVLCACPRCSDNTAKMQKSLGVSCNAHVPRARLARCLTTWTLHDRFSGSVCSGSDRPTRRIVRDRAVNAHC